MTEAPVVTAIAIVRAALQTALSGVVPSWNGQPAVFWRQAPAQLVGGLRQGTPATCLIYQSQDLGGNRWDHVHVAGWRGLIVIRALAASPGEDAAEAQLAAVPGALAALVVPAGYAIGVRFDRPVVLPEVDKIVTSAAQWWVELKRTS